MSKFDAKAFLAVAPRAPGVYRMLSSDGTILYVGKAKDLQKRLVSYFLRRVDSPKTRALVRQIAAIDTTVTATETEALLLEHSLIKQYRPRFNVLLRDDKSYPYLFLSAGNWPRLSSYRGSKRAKGDYFGPFPSASAVRETLALAQKLFRVRQCDESYFKHRTRPCLQYQIGRCKAPCVARVDIAEYQKDVEYTRMLLRGENQGALEKLIADMKAAASTLDYEKAASQRDQIRYLQQIVSKQSIESGQANLDILACAAQDEASVVHVLFVRGGRVIGSRNYFPETEQDDSDEILEGFLTQFYLQGRAVPALIVVDRQGAGHPGIAASLSELSGKRVRIVAKVRGERRAWSKLAQNNAAQALTTRLASKALQQARMLALATELNLNGLPQRIECYDISHTQGEATRASCVVFGPQGPEPRKYRIYRINGITPGDDYAAMEQVLMRRFSKPDQGDSRFPQVLLIDGGKGQLSRAMEVLEGLQITLARVVGVAKGEERRAGAEQLYFAGERLPLLLDEQNPASHLIQHIRDESHRFAIRAHQRARGKVRNRSVLENIPGIGAKRRQQVLTHFGGLQQLRAAAMEDIQRVPGISQTLARAIFEFLRQY